MARRDLETKGVHSVLETQTKSTNPQEFFCCANYLPLMYGGFVPRKCHKLCDQVIKPPHEENTLQEEEGRGNASEGRKAGYCLRWIYSTTELSAMNWHIIACYGWKR